MNHTSLCAIYREIVTLFSTRRTTLKDNKLGQIFSVFFALINYYAMHIRFLVLLYASINIVTIGGASATNYAIRLWWAINFLHRTQYL